MSEATEVTPQVKAVPADTFRARLVLARIHAGDLTIKEAADRCGLNYGSWSNWERGGKPRDLLDTVERISDGLGIDRDWLLFGGPLTRETRRPGLRTIDGVTYSQARVNERYRRIVRRSSPTVRMEPVKKTRTGQGPPGRPTTPDQTLSRPAGRTGQGVRRAQRISAPLPDAV